MEGNSFENIATHHKTSHSIRIDSSTVKNLTRASCTDKILMIAQCKTHTAMVLR